MVVDILIDRVPQLLSDYKRKLAVLEADYAVEPEASLAEEISRLAKLIEWTEDYQNGITGLDSTLTLVVDSDSGETVEYRFTETNSDSAAGRFGASTGAYLKSAFDHVQHTFINRVIEVNAEDASNYNQKREDLLDAKTDVESSLSAAQSSVLEHKNTTIKDAIDSTFKSVEDGDLINQVNDLNANDEITRLLAALNANYETLTTHNNTIMSAIDDMLEANGSFSEESVEEATEESSDADDLGAKLESTVSSRQNHLASIKKAIDSFEKSVGKFMDLRGLEGVAVTKEEYLTNVANLKSEANSGEKTREEYFIAKDAEDLKWFGADNNQFARDGIRRQEIIANGLMPIGYFSSIESHGADVGKLLNIERSAQTGVDFNTKAIAETTKEKVEEEATKADRDAQQEEDQKTFEEALVAKKEEIKAQTEKVAKINDELDAADGAAKIALADDLLDEKAKLFVLEFEKANLQMNNRLAVAAYQNADSTSIEFIAGATEALAIYNEAKSKYQQLSVDAQEAIQEAMNDFQAFREDLNQINQQGQDYESGDGMTDAVASKEKDLTGRENPVSPVILEHVFNALDMGAMA